MGTKEICILVVNDDHACRNIVAFMLQHPVNSEVYHFETAIEALNTIKERKDTLELVLSNVHKKDTNRFGVIHHIEEEFKLPVILMNPDENETMSSGKGSEVTVCFMKSLSVEDINNIWASALAREKGKFVEFKSSMQENQESEEETRVFHKKRKKESQENESGSNSSTVEKKPRVVWTTEMHEKFEEAIEQLGYERAFPKKIVEVMNVPGLTRENVASHLQKYRMTQKKCTRQISDSYYGLPSSNLSRMFSSSYQNYRKDPWRPSYTSLFNSEASRTMLKLKQLSNPSYRFNGYQDDNKILLSNEKSQQSWIPDKSGSFFGLRLGNDGKSLEIGQRRVMSNEKYSQYPSYNSSISLLSKFDQRPFGQPLQGTDWNQSYHQFSISETDRYEIPGMFTSSLSNPTTGRHENSGQSSNNSNPEQQSSLSFTGNYANVRSVQCSLPSDNYVPQEETSLPPLPSLLHDFNSFTPERTTMPSLPSILDEFDTFTPEAKTLFPSLPPIVDEFDSFTPERTTSLAPILDEFDSFTPERTTSLPPILDEFDNITPERNYLPSVPPILDEFDNITPEVSLDTLLNTAAGSTSEAANFWDCDFNDALFFDDYQLRSA